MLRNIAPKSFWSAFRSGEQSQTAAPLQGSHALASIAAGIVGVILSVSAWNAVWVREDRVAELELSEHADNYALLLQYGISEDLKMLAGLRALFQSSDREITRKEYDAFTDLILRDKPAVQSLSWTPRVARMERDTLELAASRGDIPGYHIKAITPSGLVRSADRDEYFPILYSTTESVASPIYGLDINSEPMRRSTLERARDSDQPATSAVFRLPAEVGDERAFLVMLPVYRTNMPHDSVESRRRNLRGLVVGVFRVRLMAETILARATTETGLDLYLFAAGAEGQAPPIYFRAAHGQASPTGGQGLASVIAGRHSPSQFSKPGLYKTVVDALTSSGLEPARLEVEITESVLLFKSESTLATLHQLRALGVRISMDDFGTGYSSLSYLRSFPFDKIKIDGSFVHDLRSNKDSMAIVRAVTGLGCSLRMVTTAEGIETQEELDHLKREGCTEGQGYLFGKPLPAKDARALLASRAAKAQSDSAAMCRAG